MAKLVKYIFIPFFFVFLMSHNASAVDLVIDLNQYEKINTNLGGTYYDYCFSNTSANKTNVQGASFPANTYLRCARTNKSFELKKGDIYTYTLQFFSTSDLQMNYVLSQLTINPGARQKVIGLKQINNNNRQVIHPDNNYNAATYEVYNTSYQITVQIEDDVTSTLGSSNANTNDFYLQGASNVGGVSVSVGGFQIYRYSGSTVNKEQSEATQDAADKSETSGSSSSSDSQNATSSLISIITSGIGAITSASATNCVINGNMGNFDMGSIDLCANPVPTFMQVIGSIIAALVVLPLVIVLFNRFISIIGSFQR